MRPCSRCAWVTRWRHEPLAYWHLAPGVDCEPCGIVADRARPVVHKIEILPQFDGLPVIEQAIVSECGDQVVIAVRERDGTVSAVRIRVEQIAD